MSSNRTREDRSRKRFIRRWKRRLRIAAPFLSLPLLLGVLILSVDLIEYEPEQADPRASGTPVPARATAGAREDARSLSVSRFSVLEPELARIEAPEPATLSADDLALDLPLRERPTPRPPRRLDARSRP